MNQLDKSIKIAHPENPYARPTSNGIVPRRKFIQQHGFVTPNSLFNESLDRGKVSILNRTQRAFISEKLPMHVNQPSSDLERELLVPMGALQQKYSRWPNIVEVPSGVIRQGSLQLEPEPDVPEAKERIMAAMTEAETPFEQPEPVPPPQAYVKPVKSAFVPTVNLRPPEAGVKTIGSMFKSPVSLKPRGATQKNKNIATK